MKTLLALLAIITVGTAIAEDDQSYLQFRYKCSLIRPGQNEEVLATKTATMFIPTIERTSDRAFNMDAELAVSFKFNDQPIILEGSADYSKLFFPVGRGIQGDFFSLSSTIYLLKKDVRIRQANRQYNIPEKAGSRPFGYTVTSLLVDNEEIVAECSLQLVKIQ